MMCGNIKLIKQKLILGEHYELSWLGGNKIKCVFIKVTQKGYNFLWVNKNKTIFKKHLYLIAGTDNEFWLMDSINIRKIISFTEYKDTQIKNGCDYSWEEYSEILLNDN